MAYINEETINNIRKNIDIVDIISKYVPLEQKGKNYFGVCPFHDDHAPSMSVSKDKQIYKCFSCGASGNVFSFIENIENIEFPEAVAKLAEFAGIEVSGDFKKTPSVHEKEYEFMNLSLLFYQNNINSEHGLDAIEYLKKRGFNRDTINEFQIGLSLDDSNSLLSLLKARKMDIKLGESLGLISHDDKHYYDIFNKRIMFPIHDLKGQIIAYTGRIYKSESQNRYMNSRENSIFKKGNIIFNYHRARDYIRKTKELIIVEGNLDAIRLYSEGIKNVVALMGTALTKEQIDIIKKTHAKVILMLDNDEAGEHATVSIAETLFNEHIDLGIVRINDVKDPDEFLLKKGVSELEKQIKNNVNYLDFKMFYLKKKMNLNQTEELRKFIQNILTSLKNSDDEILIELTLNKISTDYNIDLDLVKKEYQNLKNVKEEKITKDEIIPTKSSKYDDLIKNILYYMMNDYKYIKGFKNKLGYIKTPIYRDISNDIIYYAEKNKDISVSDFLTYVKLENANVSEINEIISYCKYEEFSDDFFETCIENAKKVAISDEIKKLKIAMKQEINEERKLEILKKITELKKGSV